MSTKESEYNDTLTKDEARKQLALKKKELSKAKDEFKILTNDLRNLQTEFSQDVGNLVMLLQKLNKDSNYKPTNEELEALKNKMLHKEIKSQSK
jgi:hypothetical protein